MPIPSATYRIQFSLNFRFVDAEALVPYLHRLGISHLYASPRFRARKGSPHGYDVADPVRINSELGTEEEFQSLVNKLHSYDMGLLLDIVPNHMAASQENPWWMDVLESGLNSEFATYFDIDWGPGSHHPSRVLLPVLGDLYGQVLEKRQLTLRLEDRGFFVQYFGNHFPIRPETYPMILSACGRRRRRTGDKKSGFETALSEISLLFSELPVRGETAPRWSGRRREQIAHAKQKLWALYRERPAFQKALSRTFRRLNGTKNVPHTFDQLDRILSAQVYRLAYWKRAADEINYRRFFDINELVALRMDVPEVFEARHEPVFRLMADGSVDALRIDHIDGLCEPLGYLSEVRKNSGQPRKGAKLNDAYVVVEKVLLGDEALPPDWPVAGTTGYDFVNAANMLLVDGAGYGRLEEIYKRATSDPFSFADTWPEKKRQAIDQMFRGEMRRLGRRLARLAFMDRRACDLPKDRLAHALKEITACLPVYRTYVSGQSVGRRDHWQLQRAMESARNRMEKNRTDNEAMFFFERLFRNRPDGVSPDWNSEWLEFMLRWQTVTGAVMAKGFEDTAFYTYPCLISLNEVGAGLLRTRSSFGQDAFHRFNKQRRHHWPQTMNASSTHDTKRSEDVRARIHVLSEIPEEWEERFTRWARWNKGKHGSGAKRVSPSPAEEFLIYQTLMGAWPFGRAAVEEFKRRLTSFVIKAAREAKQLTSWLAPNEAHENTLREFVMRIFDESKSKRFIEDARSFQSCLAFHGALNSLSQVVLKIASPGVPDFYQGNELWDFSMTDPDNRRPVDFETRIKLLDEIGQQHGSRRSFLSDLIRTWRDGRIKLFITARALQFRRSHQTLFLDGDYVPVRAKGDMAHHVCAFLRRAGKEWLLAVVPLLTTGLIKPGRFPIGESTWGGSTLVLPDGTPDTLANIFTDETTRSRGRKQSFFLRDIFSQLPVALLFSSE